MIEKIFAGKFLKYAGKISFSLYLWHAFLIQPIGTLPIGSSELRTALFFAVTFGVADLSYRFIERPIMKSRGLSDHFDSFFGRFWPSSPVRNSNQPE